MMLYARFSYCHIRATRASVARYRTGSRQKGMHYFLCNSTWAIVNHDALSSLVYFILASGELI